MNDRKIIWFFDNCRRVKGIEKSNITLEEAKQFIRDKYNHIKSLGKEPTLHHDGKMSYLLNKTGYSSTENTLCYQIG